MKSKVIANIKGKQSVRVTIPLAVKDMLNLAEGDYVTWTPEVKNGEIRFYVEKEPTTKKNIPKHPRHKE